MDAVGLHVDTDGDLTIVTLTGLLEIEQVRHLIRQPEFGTTTRVLWDCRQTSFANIARESLTLVAREHVDLLKKQATRRTAVVVSDDEAIPFARLYFEIARHQFGRDLPELITTDMDEARLWLDSGDGAPDHTQPGE